MKKILCSIILLLALGGMIYSGWNLYTTYSAYQKGDALYNKIADEVISVPQEEWEPQVTDAPDDVEKEEKKHKDKIITVNVPALKQENSDILGWLYIPNSSISYPLLQADDNDTYLHLAYNKVSSVFGSIFMDCTNAPDFSDQHTVIYGHNMRNGSMFGGLKQYQNEEYFRSHRNIYIITENGTARYRVFSCHMADAGGTIYATSFGDKKAYKEYLKMIREKSYFATNTEVMPKDSIITLSTCTGAENTRFVVHAVYKGEVEPKK